ncbi:hypothetical protein SAMN04515671_3636 [Nakamurella panacisegetis]|uniref:Uncharacterized protein n=1 Tax=Nakamurella panacisegetis TaxID=1090615 RepID=A0A1H0RKX3_9ACTN|nr:hypothetical protein [Nakamurella panacisegetis]SDP30173.1 hypothetical protein SAMN04515671_3636 [Nakamurella panacisegetis]
MSSVLKSLSARRETARRERNMWRMINNSTSSMRNELIEMRDRQLSGHR